MRGSWPIIKREYVSRITTKGFWISTALLPLFTIGMALVPLLTARMKSADEPVRILDAVGDFYPVLERMIADRRAEGIPPVEPEMLGDRDIDAVTTRLNEMSDAGEIQGYIVIDDTIMDSDEVFFYARNPSSAIGEQRLTALVASSIRRYRLQRLGIEGEEVDQAVRSVGVEIRKATNDPKRRQESGTSAFLTSFALVLFIYFSLIFYGVHVLRGVLEEKSNRIVEIIVSTTRPFDLMIGKIFGIGAVGLTQVGIWSAFGFIISAPQITMAIGLSRENLPHLTTASIVFFPIYFLLGFFLYATLYAGIGSMFNSEEDAQQMVSVATIMLVIPMVVMTPVMKNPSSPLSVALSLFPFFTPILMYLRIGVQVPPVWQIAASIVIMVVAILLMIWLVAKIYRIGILMYGKKPTIPELIRWFRYS